jgi:hypothetical protein
MGKGLKFRSLFKKLNFGKRKFKIRLENLITLNLGKKLG